MKAQSDNAPQKVEWNLEAVKLIYDYLKHITTLCSASILVVVTFNEKLANANYKICLKISLILFILSIISAIISLPGVAVLPDSEFSKGSKDGLWGESKTTALAFASTLITFVSGLISLIVFGFANF
jgi:hypothetical protein